MVTVIIAALNEAATIQKVVDYAFKDPLVNEVIVVDDQSEDDTAAIAIRAGAKVLTSAVRGKGTSMQEGVEAASNQLLVFLDADIDPYPVDGVKKLLRPLLNRECDFVKGSFSRNAGRVTELVAKPLLKIFYPELAQYEQPLSGMIAGRKSFFSKIDFMDDYGVDVGILIDMFLMQARIQEVNIGYIENKSKPWQMLGRMSGEVARAITRKATLHNNSIANLKTLGAVATVNQQMGNMIKEELSGIRKMIVFDMDDTLLEGRFIDACAQRFIFDEELARLRSVEKDPAVLTKRIAKLLQGLSIGELLQVAASIPLVQDAIAVVEQLRNKGYVVGIVSDSYQFVVDYVKNKLGADFAIGNQLNFFEGKATGEVTIPSYFYYHLHSKCTHALCKTNALLHASQKFGVPFDNIVAIGDSANDLCMIQQAGLGIAFCTKEDALRKVADKVIDKKSFRSLLDTPRILMEKITPAIAV